MVWQMVPVEMRNLSFEDFRNKIKRWEHDGCDSKLYKDLVSNFGYVNLVWLWDIGLTVRINNIVWFQVLGNPYYDGICLLGVDSGVWNRCKVNNDGNTVMSIMSFWCLYCWIWVYFTVPFCVSFVGFVGF